MEIRKFIILGLNAQGLAILRELGEAGVDVTAFCQSSKDVGYYSKYGEKIIFNSINELKRYISAIVMQSKRKPFCYITSGGILALVLQEYKELYEICDVSSGPYHVIEMLAHKDRMYEYASARGLYVARYVTLDKYCHGQLSFPLFLKRNFEIPLFFKDIKIESKEDLDSYIDRIPTENLCDVIVQEYIKIAKSQLMNLSYQGYYVDGYCCGAYLINQKRRLKKGITSYFEEITDPQVLEPIKALTNSFIDDLDYNGFIEFEFMFDALDGKLYFMEVNTRPCGTQSGIHYKFSNLRWILTHPAQKIELIPRIEHLCWMNIMRDIRVRVQNFDFKSCNDITQCKFDIWKWGDLKPFFSKFKIL